MSPPHHFAHWHAPSTSASTSDRVSHHWPLLRLWRVDAELLPCSQARNACAAAGPDRGSIGASCGRDRALARPVEHSMGTERSHQPEADALARCPAVHRALPEDGRALSVGQITGEEMDQKPRNRQTVGLRPRAGDSRSALGQPSSARGQVLASPAPAAGLSVPCSLNLRERWLRAAPIST